MKLKQEFYLKCGEKIYMDNISNLIMALIEGGIRLITMIGVPLIASAIFVSKSRKHYITLDEQGDDTAWLFISHLLVALVFLILEKNFY